MSEHALLSASSAERWSHCTGSGKLAALFSSTSSPAAEEGTLAHEMARILIEYNAGDLTKAEKKKQLDALKKQVEQFYEDHKDMPGSFKAMENILTPYVTYVWERFQEIKKLDEAAVLLAEQRVDFSDIVPGGFGTSDVVIIGADKAIIIDLKYGKGVRVSAVDNPQIRLYAVGAINEFSLLYEFEQVEVVIYQPRLDSVTSQDLSVKELQDWAENVIKPAAIEAAGDHGTFTPGPWCDSHFCPARAKCRARAEWLLEMEQYTVEDPALLTNDEIGAILPRLGALSKFAKKVEDYVIGAIKTGHPVSGWKLIEGQSRRTYKDEAEVAKAIIAAGYDRKDLYEEKLLGITKMSDFLGKKKFKELIEDTGLCFKPPGNPKLAPDTDPAPEFNPAAADFND